MRRRMIDRPVVRTAAVVAALGLAASACSSTDSGGDGDGGSVPVAFAAEEPYGFMDGDDLVGEAPALHKEIFDRIDGSTIEGKQYEFDALIPALNAGEVDVVSAGMFITPERCEQAIFSDPEYVAKTALMVPEGNPEGLSDFESVAQSGVKLAVMRGAVEKDQAEAAGVKSSNIEVAADQQAGIDTLTSGRADAFALTDISLNWAAKNVDGVEVTESFVPVIDGEEQLGAGAAVFREEDTELRDDFNEKLHEVLEDGDTWEKLVGEYGFTEANKPPADMTAEQFCEG